MKQFVTLMIGIFLFNPLLGQDQISDTLRDPYFNLKENHNYPAMPWNEVIGSSTLKLIRSSSGESSMNNLVCDAMMDRTKADFAFLTFGEIYADFYKGEITHLDIKRLCPFPRTLVVIEIDGEFLIRLIETSISGLRKGLAIGGGYIEYDTRRPNYQRLTYLQVGEYPVYPQKEYKLVTIDYLVDGPAGFDILKQTEPSKVFRTGITLSSSITDYIRKYSPLTVLSVRLDQRWIKK